MLGLLMEGKFGCVYLYGWVDVGLSSIYMEAMVVLTTATWVFKEVASL